MGFPVAELQDLRRRYALLVRRSGGRTLFDQTIAFDGAVEGQKVTMRTDRAEHEIHLGTLPLEKSAGYPAVWSRMSVPCKYRISGSLTNSGDFDSDFELEFNSEDVAWTGHCVTVAGRVPARGERCTVEVGKDAVSLALVEFTSGREAPGTKTSNRFAFKDLPRRYTVDLGPKVGQVFMYWAKGQDLAALAVARESIGRYEATERDPESGKPVPVVVDSRLVGVNWSGAEVLVMLGTTTMKELRERVQRGEITPEDQGEIERRYQQQVEDALAKFKADTGGIPRLEPR
jgi:hypothetical protein